MRLIDADELNYKTVSMCLSSQYAKGYNDAIEDVKNAPVAVPVVHAHWIHDHDVEHYGKRDGSYWRCSSCGRILKDSNWFSYCPMCGARMDEK